MNEDLSSLDKKRAWRILAINTVAFTVCFACWMMNGVLVTFLVDNGVFRWSPSQMGWLIGIPVLTGSIFRLPLGLATDRWGGRIVFGLLMLFASLPMFLVGYCQTYGQFLAAGLGFGLVGTSFAVGIAYTSVWFPRKFQGTALGIFGAGNAGAALTSLGAPHVLGWLTDAGENLEGWRNLPRLYSLLLAVMGLVFLSLTKTRVPPGTESKTLGQRLEPLKVMRVWRFGLYYFFVFGGFVALAQWLVPYYVNAYAMSVALAGALAACNSLPSGLIRALGGWMSDRFGARTVTFAVFYVCLACCALLIVPQMDIQAPGSGVMAKAAGTVTEVTPTLISVEGKLGVRAYPLKAKERELVSPEERRSGVLILPRSMNWQEPAVQVGDPVVKKQLLAQGVTHIFFQANVWVFTGLSLLLGAVMGIGKASVYKYIPEYFPKDVGVVGGIVGLIGGLGGFICPVIFGYLLEGTGLWTSCWMFFLVVIATCLLWLHRVVRRINREQAPQIAERFDQVPRAVPSA